MAATTGGGDQAVPNANAAVLLPVVQPPDMWEHNQNTYFFQESNVLLKHCFHPARSKKTTIPINTVTPHPKFLAYFHKTEIGRRKGLDSLTPNELAQISSNLPSDLQQELLNEDDGGENDKFRHSQKFKFEQCKQAAFNLLRKVAFTLESFDEEEQTVTEELESLLLESLDQLSANAAYEKRDWQTQAYKEEALALERERADMVVTPSLLQPPSTADDSLKGGVVNANNATAANVGAAGGVSGGPQQCSQSQDNITSSTLAVPPTPMATKRTVSKTPALRAPSAQLASVVVTAASIASSRPGTTDGGSENRDTLGPLPSAQTISKLKGAFRGSAKQRRSSGSRGGDSSDEGSETGSRRSRLSTRSGNRSNSLNWPDHSSQAVNTVVRS
ncbi:uncharacterized protein LOC142355986, partial [Convolutriloba macropyga]|uniref:uncharacterized protein LOC142355986 n=1 Tax=Convolutriloba macropyga TaxID=536237 RepID=UPI003F51B2B7